MKRHAQDFATVVLAMIVLACVDPLVNWIADCVLP